MSGCGQMGMAESCMSPERKSCQANLKGKWGGSGGGGGRKRHKVLVLRKLSWERLGKRAGAGNHGYGLDHEESQHDVRIEGPAKEHVRQHLAVLRSRFTATSTTKLLGRPVLCQCGHQRMLVDHVSNSFAVWHFQK